MNDKQLLVATVVGVIALLASGCESSIYTRCNGDGECDDGQSCFEVTVPQASGRFCSHSCTRNHECEGNLEFPGACYALLGDPTAICYQQCVSDRDCYSTSRCLDVLDSFGNPLDRVCMPDN